MAGTETELTEMSLQQLLKQQTGLYIRMRSAAVMKIVAMG
jgi:hypothetical protein